ncbi:LytTR family DNA-binding domain-containing protein [Paenibacillus sp. FSL R5-0908]|uniref:LytTR family DNA-binding domain-containing protein n=1 Tax=Paenibacillus sp. FSL R5-0908 TaxID=2921664 RepID=UPI0030F9F2AA
MKGFSALDSHDKPFWVPTDGIVTIQLKGHVFSVQSVNKNGLLPKNLYEMVMVLPDNLVRINKNTIINLNYVKEFRKPNVVLITGDIHTVSRRNLANFRQRFANL